MPPVALSAQDLLTPIRIPTNTSTTEVLDSCSENSDLRGDLGLTSIGVLYLAISIENTFNLEFNDASFDDFNTVKDVIDYIEANQK